MNLWMDLQVAFCWCREWHSKHEHLRMTSVLGFADHWPPAKFHPKIWVFLGIFCAPKFWDSSEWGKFQLPRQSPHLFHLSSDLNLTDSRNNFKRSTSQCQPSEFAKKILLIRPAISWEFYLWHSGWHWVPKRKIMIKLETKRSCSWMWKMVVTNAQVITVFFWKQGFEPEPMGFKWCLVYLVHGITTDHHVFVYSWWFLSDSDSIRWDLIGFITTKNSHRVEFCNSKWWNFNGGSLRFILPMVFYMIP